MLLSFICTCFFSQEAGLRPNVQVFSALIGRAIRRLDYIYLKTLLKTMSSMEVWPNEVIIRQLEFASQYPPSYNQVSVCTGVSPGDQQLVGSICVDEEVTILITTKEHERVSCNLHSKITSVDVKEINSNG